MRPAVWGAASAMVLGLAVQATADIYRYRDRSGTLVFTNAPAAPSARLMRELPPASRMLVPMTREALRAELAKPLPRVVPTSYDRLIREIAERYAVEYALVKAVIKAESDFDRLAVSRKGALGLMQLMPQTAAQHQVVDVFLPRDNIEGGCRHLRMLLDRYGGNLPLAIAAYNAGTRTVEDAGGVPPIAETQDYLDGWLARRHGMTTALGQLLDPLADKLIVAAALIMLAAVPPEPRVPAWMVVVIVLRELAVTGLRGIASSGGVTLAAQELGKYKMILQMFALEALLVHYRYPIPGTGLEIDFHAGGLVFLWMALVLGVWSGVDYYVRILRQIRLD